MQVFLSAAGCVCPAVLLVQLTSGGWILHENLIVRPLLSLLLIRQPVVRSNITQLRLPLHSIAWAQEHFHVVNHVSAFYHKNKRKEIWHQIKGPKTMPSACFLSKPSSHGYTTALSFPLLLTSFTLSTSKMSTSTYIELYTNWFN